MKHFLAGFLLVALPQFASAGITVETQSVTGGTWLADTLVSGWATTAITGAVITDADMRYIADSVWYGGITNAVGAIYKSGGNAETHYKSGLDTVIFRHRIECDTTTVERFIINDTSVIRLSVECDTVYRVEYRPIWEPKIKVYLEPEQLKQLMWLIENQDQIEMKKTYGKKE